MEVFRPVKSDVSATDNQLTIHLWIPVIGSGRNVVTRSRRLATRSRHPSPQVTLGPESEAQIVEVVS